MYYTLRHILEVAQELRRLMDGNLKEQGLTMAQIHVLGFLDWKSQNGEVCIQRELCAACGNVRAPSVTSLLKTLEQDGYITRSAGQDAREKYVALTEEGERIARECKQFMDRVEEYALKGFEEDEIKILVDYLDRTKKNLSEFSKIKRSKE